METVALFNKNVEEHIHNFRGHSQPNLNWDALKGVYGAARDMVIGKPPRECRFQLGLS